MFFNFNRECDCMDRPTTRHMPKSEVTWLCALSEKLKKFL